MTPPRRRVRVPRPRWGGRLLLLGAVPVLALAGCTGTAPSPTGDTVGPGATTSTAAPPTTAPPPTGDTVGTSAAPAEAAATPDVECGLTVGSDGQQVLRYCGEGSARVELPLRTLEFGGAECDVTGSFATVNAGVSYSDREAAEGDYVGVVLGGLEEDAETAAGHVAIELVVRGTTLALRDLEATVDLRGGALEATVLARTAEDGPVRIELGCPAPG